MTGKLFDMTGITNLSIIFTMNNDQVTWSSCWVTTSQCVPQLHWRGNRSTQCCSEHWESFSSIAVLIFHFQSLKESSNNLKKNFLKILNVLNVKNFIFIFIDHCKWKGLCQRNCKIAELSMPRHQSRAEQFYTNLPESSDKLLPQQSTEFI